MQYRTDSTTFTAEAERPQMRGVNTAKTLTECLRAHARSRPHARAVTFEGHVTTYSELDQRSNEVAIALIDGGVCEGRRFAFLGKNSDQFILLLLGAAKAGAVVVPLNWRLSTAEIIAVLRDSEAVGLLLSGEFAAAGEEIVASIPTLRLVLNGEPHSDQPFASWSSRAHAQDPHGDRHAAQVVVQLYTSGTTGRPKGVMLTHDSLVHQRRDSEEAGVWWDVHSIDDVMLLALTVSHVGGLAVIVRSLYAGAHTVVVREFDPAIVLDCIQQHRITRITVVPSTLQMLLRHPRSRSVDYSSLKIIQYGASPIPLDLLREGIAMFACGFVQVYGMTETGGSVTALGPADHDPAGNTRMRSVGVPLPGVQIQVFSPDETPAPPGTIGEILVRSRAIMSGYWNLPEETVAALTPSGWLRTGDAGYLDADGYLYLCDRIKDMICSGAENIYPTEVENAIYDHPAVADVTVIGVPDPTWGEAVKALVVLRAGESADPETIIAHARERIARYKVPKTVDFVPALPRNAAGKIQRRALREPYWEGFERRVN
jgi:acyl-CoA synthetase (AMP-forming)/AMP-acid ligase II